MIALNAYFPHWFLHLTLDAYRLKPVKKAFGYIQLCYAQFLVFMIVMSLYFILGLCTCIRMEQKWVEVTNDTQVDALINAVNNGLNTMGDSSSGSVRTMVFANTVEAAEAVAMILTGAEIRCLQYHSSISLEERTKNLVDFQQKGGVFVCTDAAARGLDIPNTSHVIQVRRF